MSDNIIRKRYLEDIKQARCLKLWEITWRKNKIDQKMLVRHGTEKKKKLGRKQAHRRDEAQSWEWKGACTVQTGVSLSLV